MKNKQFTQYKKLLQPMLDLARDGSLSMMQEWQLEDMFGTALLEVMHAPSDTDTLIAVKNFIRQAGGAR